MPISLTNLHPANLPLTDISIRYNNSSYIGERLFPTVTVVKENDRFAVYDKANFRVEETTKGENSESNKGNYTVSTGQYAIVVHSFETIVTPRMIAAADTPLAPFQDATEYCTDVIKQRLETDIATNVMASSTYAASAQSTTGSPAWNDSSGSCVVQVVSAKFQIAKQIGRAGNTGVTDVETFVGLKGNTVVLDRVKYTSAEAVTTQTLARLMELDNIFVGENIQNTAVEGDRADAMSFSWSEGFAVLYVEPNPGIRKPTFGYMFRLKGGRIVETRPAPEIETGAVWVRCIDAYDDKVIDTSAGYLLRNTKQ